MPPVSSKTFITRLRKLFKGQLIELAYVYDDKETILVNGEEINLMWIPHVSKIEDDKVVSILYSDCKKYIRKLLRKQIKRKTNGL
tara:strand:- start:181 stop:435 length:255 start_codon:yes stop_codon:yes gene_type:complete